PGGALTAGIRFGSQLVLRNRFGQSYRDARGFDRKNPAAADRVPIELIVVGEEPELPRRAIANRERVVGRHGQEVVVARVDANAVADALREPRFGSPVTLDAEDVEADDDTIAVPIAVPRREVAIDAPADPLALRADSDVRGHEKRAVTLDVDFDVVSGDAFLRGGDRADQERDARQ